MTPRQQEFTRLYNLGLSLADIARQMGIAVNTAGAYVTACGLGGTRRAPNGAPKDGKSHHGGNAKKDRTRDKSSAVYLRPGAKRLYSAKSFLSCELGSCPREAQCRERVAALFPVECELQ